LEGLFLEECETVLEEFALKKELFKKPTKVLGFYSEFSTSMVSFLPKLS
jgi:hypothetical protein